MTLEQEIAKRRTFGIISHPDAGKTTLTEKLLLFGGAIQKAGAVKSSKIKDHARSDWMEIEKQRGISVATSVMGFNYKDIKINLLDTPGHQDFAEDTYRTLTAVDSVIMVVDCVKGVEMQTEKLMEVCRMRNTPVLCFINKLDRERSDFDRALASVQEKFGRLAVPIQLPIGQLPHRHLKKPAYVLVGQQDRISRGREYEQPLASDRRRITSEEGCPLCVAGNRAPGTE